MNTQAARIVPTFELYTRPMTPIQFAELLRTAPPGFPIVYHVGDVAWDRQFNAAYPYQKELDALAGFVYSKRNEAHLVQKKITFGCYEYRAVKK